MIGQYDLAHRHSSVARHVSPLATPRQQELYQLLGTSSIGRLHLERALFSSCSQTGGGGDPRVGSTRNGSSGGTISASSNNKSDSAKNLAGTFIPVAVLLGVCVLLFLLLRPRLRRVYAPRAIAALRAPEFVNSCLNVLI